MDNIINQRFTPKDFKSDQEVKWCPGCGDHAILNSVQKALPIIAQDPRYKKETFTFISGIGCSSRFPYYMKTFGFHSIHGRAAVIATGAKVANPKLSVWQVSGDGDALAIGGNHFIHAIRRNIDLNILLFNNEIYGLTKGQYSPTSKLGIVTKTSPFGTFEHPFCPGELVLGARGTFFARTIDVDQDLSVECLVESAHHDGTSVVEVLQNCVIFNENTHGEFADKAVRKDRTIIVRHGEPLIFGENKDKGLVLEGLHLKIVNIGEGGWKREDILIHNAAESNPGVHMMLVNMKSPEFPVALGVIRNVKDSTYEMNLESQLESVLASSKFKNVDDLLNSGDTWIVE